MQEDSTIGDATVVRRRHGNGRANQWHRPSHGSAAGDWAQLAATSLSQQKVYSSVAQRTREAATQQLSRFSFCYKDGHRYVGGFVGTYEAESEWIEPQINQWVKGVKELTKVARRFPQTAYAGLTKSLQSEWQYLQQVTPYAGKLFDRLEATINSEFLPTLL